MSPSRSVPPAGPGGPAPGADGQAAPGDLVRVGWRAYAGLFLISLATLMFEVLLTRIFSVTMWYHYAFMAISVAMFGMTAGAISVFLRPKTESVLAARLAMALAALGFAVTSVLWLLTQLELPLLEDRSLDTGAIAITFVVTVIPFYFSGVSVTIALTHFPRCVSRLYAADLVGAALGCLLFVLVIDLTDASTTLLVVATLAGLGALVLMPRVHRAGVWVAAVVVLGIGGLAVAHGFAFLDQRPFLRFNAIKGSAARIPVYEAWNAFSRVTVTGDPSTLQQPFGWGFSARMPPVSGRWLLMSIDGSAGTPLTAYDGDPESVSYLGYDCVNLVHYLRRQAEVLVVGSGGGRDLLSALAFGQSHVVGVELNPKVMEALTGPFAELTGHLERNPKVELIVDEARSWVARTDRRFDIIQLALIDTWAATSAGAFALAENTLYTVEGWTAFLERLKPQGLFTVSRWYTGGMPGEAHRLVALASETLSQLGIDEPRAHIALVRQRNLRSRPGRPDGVGTILVGREPFSAADLDRLEAEVARLGFEIVLSPRHAATSLLATLADAPQESRLGDIGLDLSAPTDDRPFFFHMVRLADAFLGRVDRRDPTLVWNVYAVHTLAELLLTVIVVGGALVGAPLIRVRRLRAAAGARRSAPIFLYFVGIGFGYLLIEMALVQRLTVFLGHPTHGLSVVLAGILVASGVGSGLTDRASPGLLPRPAMGRLAMLLACLAAVGLLIVPITDAAVGASGPMRVLIALGLILPLGVCMGMAFPLGMKLASQRVGVLMPWLWAVNGAASICATVIATALALTLGISVSYWCGVASYALSLGAFGWAVASRETA